MSKENQQSKEERVYNNVKQAFSILNDKELCRKSLCHLYFQPTFVLERTRVELRYYCENREILRLVISTLYNVITIMERHPLLGKESIELYGELIADRSECLYDENDLDTIKCIKMICQIDNGELAKASLRNYYKSKLLNDSYFPISLSKMSATEAELFAVVDDFVDFMNNPL